MSMPPPAPPPPPPPPPNRVPPSFGTPQPGAAPPGYLAYGTGMVQGQLRPSKGLSKAMVALYWCTTASAALVGAALYHRKGVWDDVFADGDVDFIELTKVDDADTTAAGALLLQMALTLAAAILTCLWAKRIADNARARGVTGVRPGLAAGGWFIPIGWYFVGFNELRKSGKGVGVALPSLLVWQILFVVQNVVWVVINRLGDTEWTGANEQDISDRLGTQGIVGLAGAIVFAAATVFAMRSARELDAGVTGSA